MAGLRVEQRNFFTNPDISFSALKKRKVRAFFRQKIARIFYI